MKRTTLVMCALALAAAGLLVTGCESNGDSPGSGPEGGMMAPPFGGPADMARAATLWRSMSGYRSWSPWPGLGGFQPGRSPHGKHLKYYANGAALRNTASPGAGSIIVKENFMAPNDASLAAITVMQKVPGYDPENGNWFWVKYDRNGNVMKNPKGMSLAGRVAKGMAKGCIACHKNAGGGDMLFVNDE